MMSRTITLVALLLLALPSSLFAEGSEVENIDKYRLGADMQIKLAKGLKLNIAPELRFNEGFESLLLNGEISYKVLKNIYLGATYRLTCNREASGITQSGFGYRTDYDWDYLHRYAFDVTYKDRFGRYTPSFRIRYNNFADSADDDEAQDQAFLRYRTKVEYNIRKCSITPFASAEAYQRLSDDRFYKMRYTTGLEFKLDKPSSIELSYKLDIFRLEYKNAHIFNLGYKYKF